MKSLWNQDDTISAVSTPRGEGGICIIRISGPKAVTIAQRVFSSKTDIFITPERSIAYGKLLDPVADGVIDEALCIYMPSPKSYTTEDVVELQFHGGDVVAREVMSAIINAGGRIAEPGEFTKRAFLNGRIDLSQAEAVMDLIQAKSSGALRNAVCQLSGRLSKKIHVLRKALLETIVHINASCDFPEDDIEEPIRHNVEQTVQRALADLESLLSNSNKGKILRDGLQTVIIGRPNVGKSSLLNALLRDERALVSSVPGTTRDSIEEYMDISGIPLRIVDTAGLRDTSEYVEQLGVERTRTFLRKAELVLWVIDSSEPLTEDDKAIFGELFDVPLIVVFNKSDLPVKLDKNDLLLLGNFSRIVEVSSLQNEGLERLEKLIFDFATCGDTISNDTIWISNLRHRDLLLQAKETLHLVELGLIEAMPLDCIVIDIQLAHEQLGYIVGESVSIDIVDEIFSRFCVGK